MRLALYGFNVSRMFFFFSSKKNAFGLDERFALYRGHSGYHHVEDYLSLQLLDDGSQLGYSLRLGFDRSPLFVVADGLSYGAPAQKGCIKRMIYVKMFYSDYDWLIQIRQNCAKY